MESRTEIIIWSLSIIVLIAAAYGLYYSVPHEKATPVSEALKNPNYYREHALMIEGVPVLLSSVKTPHGFFNYYALKDSSGQIPVSGDTEGFELDVSNPQTAVKIGVVGLLGDVCVNGHYNETSAKMVCDKKEIGIISSN